MRFVDAALVVVVCCVGCSYPEFGFVAPGEAVDSTVVGGDTDVIDVPDTTVTDGPSEAESTDTGVTADASLAEDGAVGDTFDALPLPDTTIPDTFLDVPLDTQDAATDTRDAADTAPVYVYLVGFGSTWLYRDDNNVPGSTWTGTGFYDDTKWKSGAAPLGYGTGSETTTVEYGGDAGAKFTTTWFRKSINVADETKYDQLRVRLKRDDGAVVYLNGVELLRSNMPSGTIGATTLATTTINDETTIYVYTASVTPLKTGTNVLAVEIHQANGTSSDIFFDLELTARLAP